MSDFETKLKRKFEKANLDVVSRKKTNKQKHRCKHMTQTLPRPATSHLPLLVNPHGLTRANGELCLLAVKDQTWMSACGKIHDNLRKCCKHIAGSGDAPGCHKCGLHWMKSKGLLTLKDRKWRSPCGKMCDNVRECCRHVASSSISAAGCDECEEHLSDMKGSRGGNHNRMVATAELKLLQACCDKSEQAMVEEFNRILNEQHKHEFEIKDGKCDLPEECAILSEKRPFKLRIHPPSGDDVSRSKVVVLFTPGTCSFVTICGNKFMTASTAQEHLEECPFEVNLNNNHDPHQRCVNSSEAARFSVFVQANISPVSSQNARRLSHDSFVSEPWGKTSSPSVLSNHQKWKLECVPFSSEDDARTFDRLCKQDVLNQCGITVSPRGSVLPMTRTDTDAEGDNAHRRRTKLDLNSANFHCDKWTNAPRPSTSQLHERGSPNTVAFL